MGSDGDSVLGAGNWRLILTSGGASELAALVFSGEFDVFQFIGEFEVCLFQLLCLSVCASLNSGLSMRGFDANFARGSV